MPDGSLGWQVKAIALRMVSTEIDGWCRINDVKLEGWQIAAIQLIDEIHVRLTNSPPTPAAPAAKTDGDSSGWKAVFTAMGLRKEQKS